MIRNYLKTAIRNLLRNKGYATINISGLAVGIASCILLFVVVRYELSYDKFQPNYDRIYRVVTQDKYADGIKYTSGTPYPALDALRVDCPQATTGVLYATYGSQVTVLGKDAGKSFSEKKFIEQSGIFFADP